MHITPLVPYARLPRARSGARQEILHSTVDAFGRAHWLLAERRGNGGPYDASVVTVDDGRVEETRLSAVTARYPMLDALPDGGFVVADARRRGRADHVQIFDALGRASWSFAVGDAIEHLLADESGDLWVGYFDEGVFGDDPLSEAGVRSWSPTGESLWELPPSTPGGCVADCYALNTHQGTTWAYYYTDFPLVRVRGDGSVRVWDSPVPGAKATAVHDGGVAFFGGYGQEKDRLVLCTLAERTAAPYLHSTLVRSDGSPVGRRRVLARGPRLYVQAEPYTTWEMWDLGAPG
ncbi:hypothetical protein [Streptomyces xantholiticus]|uniref:hypothetical protein n=1 Tax=Streptomyces xantholiticus TaxID=68285 RepID=UPI0016719C0B|nr:hypothetical protein [Streptomyces xantholiticus]GGW23946.1 hypothetical protein GCM10010381_03460 [Streptomyces xantholiticus]